MADRITVAVSVDGCPYVFATRAISSITSSEEDWPDTATVLSGSLDYENSRLTWSEESQPLDGDLRSTGVDFRIFDIVPSSGPASGHNLISWLATRQTSQITSSTLATALSDSGLSIDVADGSSFGSGSQVLWIDQEAILCDSRSSNRFTVNAAGRGYYGSKAAAHSIDADGAIYPEVYDEFPFLTRRRCVLWWVDLDNIATSIWRGMAQITPRTLDGAEFSVQCQSIWDYVREKGLVEPSVQTRLRGFNAVGLAGVFSEAAVEIGSATLQPEKHVFNSLNQMLDFWNGNVQSYILGLGAYAGFHCTTNAANNQITWTTDYSTDHSTWLWTGDFAHRNIATSAAGTHRAVNTIDAPSALVMTLDGSYTSPIPIDNVYGMPTAWAPQGFTNNGFSTYITPILTGQYDDDIAIDIRTLAADPFTASDSNLDPPGPTFTGLLRDRAVNPLAADPVTHRTKLKVHRGGWLESVVLVDRPITLRLGAHCQFGHWAYGLEHLFDDTVALQAGVDTRNWDFSTVDAVASLIPSETAARDFHFTSESRVGDTLTNLFALSGCGVGLRGSKLSLIAFRRPGRNESSVGTITRNDIPDGEQQVWGVLEDGIANCCELTSGKTTINVRDARSIGRYGQARTVKIKLEGLTNGLDILSNYSTFAQQVLSRILFLWSSPVPIADIPVTLDWLNTAFLGDFVKIEEDILPDGAGGRGIGNSAALASLRLAAQYGLVIGREVDLNAGHMRLKMVLLPASFGYSPCIKVASCTATTVTASSAYVLNTGDYTDSTSASDYGARNFLAGMPVKLVKRDTTTYTAESLVIDHVTLATVTFTGSISAPTQASIGGGDWWDLVFDDYGNGSAVTDAQKSYAWIGDDTTRVIGTSSDPVQEWSP